MLVMRSWISFLTTESTEKIQHRGHRDSLNIALNEILIPKLLNGLKKLCVLCEKKRSASVSSVVNITPRFSRVSSVEITKHPVYLLVR